VQFAGAMKKAGNNCKLILLPNTKHAFVCVNWKATEQKVVHAFLLMDNYLVKLGYLKGKPTLVLSKNPAWKPIGLVK